MIVDDEQKDAARGFDPRYDPQFQRGYRPQPGEQPRTRVRTAPVPDRVPDVESERSRSDDGRSSMEAATLSVDPAALPRVASGALDSPSGDPGSPVTADLGAERAELVRAYAVPAPSLLDRLDLSPRRNPLMLALWIVGAGLVVLGIVLYSVSVSISYTGSTPSTDVGSLVISQLGWMLAGPMITIGLATLVALLFLTALAGRRTRSVPFGDESVDGRSVEDGDRLR